MTWLDRKAAHLLHTCRYHWIANERMTCAIVWLHPNCCHERKENERSCAFVIIFHYYYFGRRRFSSFVLVRKFTIHMHCAYHISVAITNSVSKNVTLLETILIFQCIIDAYNAFSFREHYSIFVQSIWKLSQDKFKMSDAKIEATETEHAIFPNVENKPAKWFN